MSTTPKTTEAAKFGSRIGFILLFRPDAPLALATSGASHMVCGEYGGAAFVLLYLVFLHKPDLGLPILVMEYPVGRASQKKLRAKLTTVGSPRAPMALV